ncbi:hypothetical protein EC915_101192 [Pseudomonas sp. LP_7_YM]|nr:hypothetical protein EC915_101192 [Pseudomonas sp. LP_7_YM]
MDVLMVNSLRPLVMHSALEAGRDGVERVRAWMPNPMHRRICRGTAAPAKAKAVGQLRMDAGYTAFAAVVTSGVSHRECDEPFKLRSFSSRF